MNWFQKGFDDGFKRKGFEMPKEVNTTALRRIFIFGYGEGEKLYLKQQYEKQVTIINSQRHLTPNS